MKRKKILLVKHVFSIFLITISFYHLVIFKMREGIEEELTGFQKKNNNNIPKIRARALRIKQLCESTKNQKLSEWSALKKGDSLNRATNARFEIGEKAFQLCTVLKGGSLSWKAFFKINKIRNKYLKDCEDRSKCWKNESNRLSLIQVRHPFLRLLSAWRHIFQAEGWKNLEVRFFNNSNLLKQGKYKTDLKVTVQLSN